MIVDAMNKLNIFQTSCDLNDKYDSTSGFAEMIEEIKLNEFIEDFNEASAQNGGSADNFKKMMRYDFQPVDLFESPKAQKNPKKQSKRPEIAQMVRKDIEFYINEKCLGLGDSEVEQLRESDKNSFEMTLIED